MTVWLWRRPAVIEHPKWCINGTRCCAVHCQATRVLWLHLCMLLRGLISDSLIFFWSDSKRWQLSWSVCFWRRNSLKLNNKYCYSKCEAQHVCGDGLSEHWTSQNWERVDLANWFAHWGASTTKCTFTIFECRWTEWTELKKTSSLLRMRRKSNWIRYDIPSGSISPWGSRHNALPHFFCRCTVPIGLCIDRMAVVSSWQRSTNQSWYQISIITVPNHKSY